MTAIAVKLKRKTKKKSSRKPTRAQTEAAAKKLGLDIVELDGLVATPVVEEKSEPADLTIEDKREKIEAVFKVVYESGLKYRHRYTGIRCWRVKFYDIDKAAWEKKILPKVEKLPFINRVTWTVTEAENKFGDKNVASMNVYLK